MGPGRGILTNSLSEHADRPSYGRKLRGLVVLVGVAGRHVL